MHPQESPYDHEASAQEPRQALAVYEQQRQLLSALRVEAEFLREAVAAQGAGQGVGVGARPLL